MRSLLKTMIDGMMRLKYTERFSLIGLVLGIPIMIIAFIFISQVNKDIQVASGQLSGIHYHLSLKDLMQKSQEYRELIIRDRIEGKSLNKDIQQKRKEIEATFQDLERYIYSADFSLEHLHLLNMLKRQWEAVSIPPLEIKEIKTSDLIEPYNSFIKRIIQFMKDVADLSSLYLTDEPGEYYLAHNLIYVLPYLSEDLRHMQTLSFKEILEKDYALFYHLSRSAEHHLKQLNHGHEVLLGQSVNLNQHAIGSLCQEIHHYTEQFLAEMNSYFLGEVEEKKDNHIRSIGNQSVQLIFKLYNEEINLLEQMMSTNLSTLKKERFSVLCLISLLVLLTVYCMVEFYHSIRKMFNDYSQAQRQFRQTELKLHRLEKNVSKQVLRGQEEERKRVSRELHDGIGQFLYSILVTLTAGERHEKPEEMRRFIEQAKNLTGDAMREIKRIAHSLRPYALDDLGFVPALHALVENFIDIHQIQVELRISQRLSSFLPEYDTVLFRICQEALNNIAKHSQATIAKISLIETDQEIILTIQDNGVGFNVDEYIHDEEHAGIGLLSMKERIESLEGTIDIQSTINNGTIIQINLPKTW